MYQAQSSVACAVQSAIIVVMMSLCSYILFMTPDLQGKDEHKKISLGFQESIGKGAKDAESNGIADKDEVEKKERTQPTNSEVTDASFLFQLSTKLF